MSLVDEIADAAALPHNLDAERSVLGAIILDPGAFDQVSQILRVEDFYRDAHQRIYRAIVALTERGVAVDFLTVKEELTRTKDLDDSGGPAYISALTDGLPRSTNVAHYGRIVRDKSTLRHIITKSTELLKAAYDAERDPDELLEEADRAWLDLQRGSHAAEFVSLREDLVPLTSAIEASQQNRDRLLGVTTGFTRLDELTLGWQAGDLIVLAARPSMGKTTLVLNMAQAAATEGSTVGLFSIEMKRRQVENRILSSLSGVPATRILTGHVGSQEYAKISHALEAMHGLPFYLSDAPRPTFWDIRATARRLKAKQGIGALIIDYVQLMPGSLDRRGANRNDEIADISRRLKQLAGELDCPILLLSQLSRAGAKRSDQRPRLEDLRDSGALEQDADVVAFLHRQDHRDGGDTEFIVAKQRNGPTGTVMLEFERDTLSFREKGDQTPAPDEAPAKPRRTRRLTHLGEVDEAGGSGSESPRDQA